MQQTTGKWCVLSHLPGTQFMMKTRTIFSTIFGRDFSKIISRLCLIFTPNNWTNKDLNFPNTLLNFEVIPAAVINVDLTSVTVSMPVSISVYVSLKPFQCFIIHHLLVIDISLLQWNFASFYTPAYEFLIIFLSLIFQMVMKAAIAFCLFILFCLLS